MAQAGAAYQKVLAGSTSADIEVAQVNLQNAQNTLDTTQKQQQVLVNNAYSSLLNSTLMVVPGGSNNDSVSAIVSGTYTGTDQGVYDLSVYSTGGEGFKYSGLETGSGIVSTSPQPLGKEGLFIQFSNNSLSSYDTWVINIPEYSGR